MATVAESDPSSSIFSQKNSRLPEDTVFYAIFPDFSTALSTNKGDSTELSSQLQALHIQILQTLSPHAKDYIWQHEPFNLSLSSTSNPNCICSSQIPHLHGKLRYGDNLEDEWFTVFLLFETSRRFENLSIRIWDTDGEFLLIEAAFHLPRWINPDNSQNRVFIRCGELHIVPKHRFPSKPSFLDSLSFLKNCSGESRAPDSVQSALQSRVSEYPERARKNTHRVTLRVPVSVAQVLKHEPCLISLAVEGFYDRDIDSMKYAAKMEKFLAGGNGEELVRVSVRMSRAMYAQLVQQTFQPPKCYPMPSRGESSTYREAELGMKIACGFEMIYQQRKGEGLEGKGSTWEAFRESLERGGYFEGLLPGSKDYCRLMEKAREYYRNSSLFARASEMLSAPVRRIDEILALPHSPEDFRNVEVPPDDDDSWLYNGEDELNSALQERQKEMELYNKKQKHKLKPQEQKDTGHSFRKNPDQFDLGDVAKTMQAFVHKMSSYEGAEVPDSRNKEVELDVDRFIKDMESVMRRPGREDGSDVDSGEGSSSDMDFDDYEDRSGAEENEDGEETFMDSYSNALNEELKTTTLKKSFIRANEQPLNKNEGPSNATEEIDEDFMPVDVDVNLVKSFLDSFSSQQGLPGPASNLLGLMGLQLPQDGSKDK